MIKRYFIIVLAILSIATFSNAGNPFEYPKFQAIDGDGNPVAGGKLYTYAAGTTTNKAAYTDRLFATPAANPVVLDSTGETTIYLLGEYKFILKTSADVTVWTLDNISGVASALAGTQTYVVDATEADQGAAGSGGSVKDYVDAIGATKTATLLFSRSDSSDTTTYTFSTSESIPSNIEMVFEKGAILAIDGGVTVTINGSINAGLYQIFSGAGDARGGAIAATDKIYPQWWGAVGDDSTACTTALQAAIDFYAYGGHTAFLARGTYQSATLKLRSWTKLIGEEKMTTKIKLIASTNADLLTLAVSDATTSIVGEHSTYTLDDTHIQFVEVGHLYLDGNKANNTSGNGISGVKTVGDAIWIDYSGAMHKFHDLFITNFDENGIYTSVNGSRFVDITVNDCDEYGVWEYGNDNMFSRVISNTNGHGGFHLRCQGSRLNNCKAWFNGQADTVKGYGFYVYENSIKLSQCDAQDNSYDGFRISDNANYTQLIGCTADSNGLVATPRYGFRFADTVAYCVGTGLVARDDAGATYSQAYGYGVLTSGASIAIDGVAYGNVTKSVNIVAAAYDPALAHRIVINNEYVNTIHASILEKSAVEATTTGAGEDTLQTYTIRQRVIDNNDGVRVTVSGYNSAANGNKTIKFYVGATAITIHPAANNTNSWRAEIYLSLEDSNDAEITWQFNNGGTMTYARATSAEDFSAGDIIIKVTGECADAGDTIALKQWLVERI